MSQHDQVIDNGSGLTVRTDFNSAIAALFSNSSGPVEPAVTVAGQFWWDTANASNPVLRQRNLANTGWMTVFQGGQSAIDIATGKRAGPPKDTFVWNDKLDLSGNDVMTLDDTGNLSILGNFSIVGGIKSAAAAIWAGFKTAVNRFVLNDKADGTGVDFFEVLATGIAKLKSAANAQLSLTGTGGLISWYDTAGILRSQIANNLATNTVALGNYNAAGTFIEAGVILTTGNSPFGSSGYQKLLSGMILNWGVGTADANGNVGIAFAAAFPTGLQSLVATADTITGVGGNAAYIASACTISNTGAILQARSIAAGGGVAAWGGAQVRWIAVGW